MHGSRFQKRHKQRNAHDDHNVTNDTAIIVGISFIYLCRTVKTVIVSFYFTLSYSRKCHRMQDTAICACFGLFYFPAFKPTCLTFPHRAMAGKPVFWQCTAEGTPATASHAHMTITVAGLPSRWQESGAFPFVVAPPFIYPRSALRHYIRSIFLFATPCMPTFPCRLQDGISMSFSLLGQR